MGHFNNTVVLGFNHSNDFLVSRAAKQHPSTSGGWITLGDGKILLERLERYLRWHSERYYLAPDLNRWPVRAVLAGKDSREDQN